MLRIESSYKRNIVDYDTNLPLDLSPVQVMQRRQWRHCLLIRQASRGEPTTQLQPPSIVHEPPLWQAIVALVQSLPLHDPVRRSTEKTLWEELQRKPSPKQKSLNITAELSFSCVCVSLIQSKVFRFAFNLFIMAYMPLFTHSHPLFFYKRTSSSMRIYVSFLFNTIKYNNDQVISCRICHDWNCGLSSDKL